MNPAGRRHVGASAPLPTPLIPARGAPRFLRAAARSFRASDVALLSILLLPRQLLTRANCADGYHPMTMCSCARRTPRQRCWQTTTLSIPSSRSQVLSDPYLATLISLFENTTTAYASSNRAAPVPATVANHLMIVLDTADAGPLYDLYARYGESNFSVELALGLGNQGQVDLAWAQDHMAQAMGPLLLGLAGLPAVAGQAAPHEATTPDAALYHGFGLALEAIDGQDPAAQSRWRARGQDSQEILAQQDRVQQVRDNGYLFRYDNDEPTLQLRSREQAMRTPGVVATFFIRLLERSGVYYPQRQLLWFFGYPPEEVPYAKVLLALNDMATGEQISVQGFIDSYSELFPADREMVLALADEVFGSAA